MWTPAERIKFKAHAGRVPTRDETHASRLFSPVSIGPMQLENRIWIPAMVPWRASEEGFVTEEVLDWYGRFARGGAAAIVIEATGIRDVPSGPLLRIGHDRYLPGLEALVARRLWTRINSSRASSAGPLSSGFLAAGRETSTT